MTYKLFFFLLIILIILPFSIYANRLGVTPPGQTHIYQGQDEITGSFQINAYGDKWIQIYTAKGPLKDNVYFFGDNAKIDKKITGSLSVPYTVKIPSDIKPGNYRMVIGAQQFLPPEEMIKYGGAPSAWPAIGFILTIRVPNEGKHMEGRMEILPPKIKVGDLVNFNINLLNIGTEELVNLGSTISIEDPENNVIENIETTQIHTLKSAEEGQIRALWKTTDQKAGSYEAKTTIYYGGANALEIGEGFRIGGISIQIVDVSFDLDKSVGKLFVDVKSNWNEVIPDVYAELQIKKDGMLVDTLRSVSVDLLPWKTERLTAFWERQNLPPGEYIVEIYVYYYDQMEQKQMSVSLTGLDEEAPAPIVNSPLIILSITLLIIILLINVIWFILSMKKKKKKK